MIADDPGPQGGLQREEERADLRAGRLHQRLEPGLVSGRERADGVLGPIVGSTEELHLSTVSAHVGGFELGGATAIALAVAVALAGGRGLIVAGAVTGLGLAFGWLCRRKIGGVTGDTLGAAAELSEALALVLAVGLGAP